MYRHIRLSVIAMALAFSMATIASTPDGETPAEEAVCNHLSGKANGLCSAYCEAMDCDGDPKASANACNVVESRLNKELASSGNAFPCPKLACPCSAAFQDFINTTGLSSQCTIYDGPGGEGGLTIVAIQDPADRVVLAATYLTNQSVCGGGGVTLNTTDEEGQACQAELRSIALANSCVPRELP